MALEQSREAPRLAACNAVCVSPFALAPASARAAFGLSFFGSCLMPSPLMEISGKPPVLSLPITTTLAFSERASSSVASMPRQRR